MDEPWIPPERKRRGRTDDLDLRRPMTARDLVVTIIQNERNRRQSGARR